LGERGGEVEGEGEKGGREERGGAGHGETINRRRRESREQKEHSSAIQAGLSFRF
jgi:hypothetical protein